MGGGGGFPPLAMHICAVDSGWIERQTKYREQLVKVASILLKAANQGINPKAHGPKTINVMSNTVSLMHGNIKVYCLR